MMTLDDKENRMLLAGVMMSESSERRRHRAPDLAAMSEK